MKSLYVAGKMLNKWYSTWNYQYHFFKVRAADSFSIGIFYRLLSEVLFCLALITVSAEAIEKNSYNLFFRMNYKLQVKYNKDYIKLPQSSSIFFCLLSFTFRALLIWFIFASCLLGGEKEKVFLHFTHFN